MHESLLKEYFDGVVGAVALQKDLVGAVKKTGAISSSQSIVSMVNDFEVRPNHLVKLCDEVLAGNLQPADLEVIGFCLIASDHFCWDGDVPPGDVIAETVHDWSAPEVNYRLTIDTVKKFKQRLLTGENLFTKDDSF